jgi:hypothetical protein
MQLRVALGVLAFGVVVACASQVVDGDVPAPEGGVGVEPDGGPSASGSSGGSSSSGSPSGSSSSGGPSFEDSGAAVVGGGEDTGAKDAGDADGGGATSVQCTTLSQCPYQSATNVSGVACSDAGLCEITCDGDNYDVNGVLSDGCEFANPCPINAPNGGSPTTLCPVEHQQSSATNLGSFSCDDSSSAQNVTAAVPSDDRAHSPAVIAFDGTAGAAPVQLQIYGSGGTFCQDDLNLYLQMKTGTRLQCYSLVAVTSDGTYTCAQTDPTGLCQILNGSGSYGDGTTIYVTIAKLDSCPASETDTGAFTLTGHL